MKTIICHSFPAWDTPYVKSTVELMSRLSANNRVIFVDYHYTVKDLFKNPHAPKKHILGTLKRTRKLRTEHGIIEVYNSLPVLPVNWTNSNLIFKLLMLINSWIVGFSIRNILKKVNPNDTILVNAFNPIYGHFTQKKWKNLQTIYYCYDEISGTDWAGKWGGKYEELFAPTVNQVVTTSPQLEQKMKALNANVSCVKNGVNLSIFNTSATEKTKNQKLGYVGAIDSRIDFDLLKEVATSLPNYQLELIGPVKVDLPEDLPENIKCLGSKSQSCIPDLIDQWDACLIPFVKNDLTRAIYPLKINEYLAMGKPVVSTSFSNLEDFESVAYIAENQDDFIQGIKKEIRYNNRLKIQKRISFAKGNDWQIRAFQFSKLVLG